MQKSELRVAVGGFGTIGQPVARWLDGGVAGLSLAAVSARDQEKAAAKMADFRKPALILPLEDLAEAADVVVECAPAAAFMAVAGPAVEQGRIFMPISVGALLSHMELIDRARETGARIVVPTGAIIGLDALKAAAEGTIHEVRLETRKPPRGLMGAPYLAEHGIDLENLSEPLKVFEGTAREAVKGFPANVNVSAALSLAGIGPDRTMIEIWADPGVTRNMQSVRVEAEEARFSMQIENAPSPDHPATGRITPLSVIATLRRLVSPLQVGT
ncbi:MAG: aspartate dehydrogenase [Pseudomonadota bacterium]